MIGHLHPIWPVVTVKYSIHFCKHKQKKYSNGLIPK